MGTYYTLLRFIFMRDYIFLYAGFPIHKNDTHRVIHFFRHILEFLPIRIQMCSYLQNNINQLLYSRFILRDTWSYMLDYSFGNVQHRTVRRCESRKSEGEIRGVPPPCDG